MLDINEMWAFSTLMYKEGRGECQLFYDVFQDDFFQVLQSSVAVHVSQRHILTKFGENWLLWL